MHFEAYIFDLDETLVDTASLHEAAWARTARDFGVTASSEFLLQQKGMGGRQAAKILLPEERWDECEELSDQKTAYVLASAQPGMWFPSVGETLEQLAEDKKIAVCTSSPRKLASVLLSGCEDLFSAIVTREDYEEPKPAADGLLKTAEVLQVACNECVYIGDTYNDYLAAESAKMPFFLFAERKPAWLFNASLMIKHTQLLNGLYKY